MIAADIRFEGFDVRSWTNLVSLFMPGLPARLARDPDPTDAPTAREGEPKAGSLLLVRDGQGLVLAAQHTQRGRIPELVGEPQGGTLPELCARYGAHRALVIREGVMEELAERLALRFAASSPESGYLGQVLMLLRAARELMDAGLVELWPNPIANVPVPSPATVRRALDLLLPNDRAAVMVLWDQGQLWTALTIRRRGGDIDLVTGPDLVTRWTGPLGGDWRRDYRVMVDAVARAVAPVHFGLFAEAGTVRSLLAAADPGAWAREVAVRNVVLQPMPRPVMAALGADAVRGVGRASARALGGLDLAGTLLPLAQTLRARVTQATTVTEILGFDPLAVLGAALRREDGEGEPSE